MGFLDYILLALLGLWLLHCLRDVFVRRRSHCCGDCGRCSGCGASRRGPDAEG